MCSVSAQRANEPLYGPQGLAMAGNLSGLFLQLVAYCEYVFSKFNQATCYLN